MVVVVVVVVKVKCAYALCARIRACVRGCGRAGLVAPGGSGVALERERGTESLENLCACGRMLMQAMRSLRFDGWL